jgi:uncharacterized membrane protein
MPVERIQEHVELIARHEAEFLAGRTRGEKMSDTVAAFVGSLPFVALHLVLFAVWILWNVAVRSHRFDPPPFSLLATLVGLEAIVLASFILMRQARIGRRQDERDHLMLQVLLLVEKETTALLNLERQIAQQIGLERAANAPELRELSRDTPLEQVAQTIKESLVEIEAAESVLDHDRIKDGELLG